MSGHRIGNPNPILLIDGEVKGTKKGTTRCYIAAFAYDSSPGPVALGKVHELILRQPKRPHVTTRGCDDALHQSELTVEGNAVRRRERLSVLVEHRDALAAI